MKTILLTLMIAFITIPGWAQNDLFGNLTNKYSENDGFSASRITSDMFDLYLKKRNIGEDSPVHDALKNLKNILVVSQSGYYARGITHSDSVVPDKTVKEVHQDILKHYENNGYTLFKTEKQMGEDVKIFLKKNKDKIESLALITNSKRITNLVELQGENIDLSTVSELNRALNLRGLENLYKINNTGHRAFFVPAPDVPSDEHIRGMIEIHREQIEKQNHLTDEQRRKIEIQTRVMMDKQLEMAEKHREMAEKYRRQPIFLSAPGDSTEYFIDGKKVTAEEFKNISPDSIERVEVNKGKGENSKGTIRITTRK
jgi:hypothetical protein